jgi:hypothetical protein
MNDLTREIHNDIDFIKNPKKKLFGEYFSTINHKQSEEFLNHINVLADKIKPYDSSCYENLMEIKEHICFQRNNNEFLVHIAFFYGLKTIVRYIDSDVFQMKLHQKTPKIFISHASKDIAYIDAFVSLLEKIGIKEQDKLFCSSITGYKIPIGKNIYEYLRNEFKNHELFVIFMLSKNYYESVACLNEMGAAWILQNDYQTILLPKFDYEKIDGAIDPRAISFKLDDSNQRKDRLNELIEKIILKFSLSNLNHNTSEKFRDEFLCAIDKIIVA